MAENKNIIIADVSRVQVTLAPGSEDRKKQFIQRAKSVIEVVDAQSQEFAVQVARELRTELKAVEEMRSSLKRPVTQLGRDIDLTAETYTQPIENELNRILKSVSGFQAAEQKRIAEENRRREEEINRRLAAEQEAARKKAEAEAALSTPTAGERELAVAVTAEQEAQKAQAATDAAAGAPVAFVRRTTGMQVRKVVKFEVIDIHELYKARPELVRLEPNRQAINAIISANTKIPGIRIWEEVAAGVRV